MSDDKVVDRDTGISIRFVRQYDVKADLNPSYYSLCACGHNFWSRETFRAHWLSCPFTGMKSETS